MVHWWYSQVVGQDVGRGSMLWQVVLWCIFWIWSPFSVVSGAQTIYWQSQWLHYLIIWSSELHRLFCHCLCTIRLNLSSSTSFTASYYSLLRYPCIIALLLILRNEKPHHKAFSDIYWSNTKASIICIKSKMLNCEFFLSCNF